MKLHFTYLYIISIFSSASLASNSIDFLGKITESTCDVSVSGSPTSTVHLPRILNSQLPSVGSVAGLTPFILFARECSVLQGNTLVAAFFNASSTEGVDINNVDSETGYLNNLATISAASDIKLRIRDSAASYIKVGSDSQIENNKYQKFQYISTQGNNTYIPYIVEYIKTADTGHDVGAVRGVVVYDLMYK